MNQVVEKGDNDDDNAEGGGDGDGIFANKTRYTTLAKRRKGCRSPKRANARRITHSGQFEHDLNINKCPPTERPDMSSFHYLGRSDHPNLQTAA